MSTGDGLTQGGEDCGHRCESNLPCRGSSKGGGKTKKISPSGENCERGGGQTKVLGENFSRGDKDQKRSKLDRKIARPQGKKVLKTITRLEERKQDRGAYYRASQPGKRKIPKWKDGRLAQKKRREKKNHAVYHGKEVQKKGL